MHSSFTTETFSLVVVTDTGDHSRAKTVTNDVEGMLARLVAEGKLRAGVANQCVIACDSEGDWAQVVIDSECAFVRFEPILGDFRPRMKSADPRALLAALLLLEIHFGRRHDIAH